jgi:hypothetical protein
MAIGMVQRFYEFGRFRLDGTGRVLFRGDQAVPLSPKAADVLLLLVQNPGSVVEKKELLGFGTTHSSKKTALLAQSRSGASSWKQATVDRNASPQSPSAAIGSWCQSQKPQNRRA